MDLRSAEKKLDDIEKKKLKRQKNAEKVRKWRERQKFDKDQDEELKKKDRERKQLARAKERREARASRSKLEEKRTKKREEMRQYRKRKKEKQNIKLEEAKKKKKEEDSETLKKKMAVKRTQEWRMRIKLRRDKESDVEQNGEITENVSCFSSRAKKSRQMRKTKSTLPKTPTKRAEIVKSLIRSPSTSKILCKEGVIVSPECKKKLEIAEQVISSLKENIEEVKQPNSSKSEKKHAYNILRATIQKKTKNKSGAYVRKLFSFTHRSKQLASRIWWQKHARKRRKDSINDNIKLLVKKYYLSAEVSREVPNKREVVKIKTDDGKKETLQKHVMTMTLDDAFKHFKSLNPDIKIGFTMFRKIKPENVRKISETSRRSCLCQVCCNVALKVDALKNHTKTIKTPANTEQLTSIELNKDRLSNETMCPYQDLPNAQCLNRTCNDCGTQKMTEYLKPIIDECQDEKVTWFKWESTEINKDNKIKRCISCVPKEHSFPEFLTEMKKDLELYPGHIFRAKWQQKQMTNCIKNLKPGSVAMVMDFSENYGCVFQSEVQSGFFDRNQVTVHPMMAYYKVIEEGEEERTVKHAIIGISEDNKHDADAVVEFENKALEIVSKEIDITEVHEWTDGCAAQYKGKKSFADISLRRGTKIYRNYFETSHGKNVCDGLGAIVKNSCYQAVISSRKVIGNAQDVYDHCEQKLTTVKADEDERTISKRQFILVSGIKRDRPETQVDTMKGTRKIHAVRNTGHDYKLQTRKLSCYCLNCSDNSGECNHVDYCHEWEDQTLKLTKEALQNTSRDVATQLQVNKEPTTEQMDKSHNDDDDDAETEQIEDGDQGTDGTKNLQEGMFVAITFTSKRRNTITVCIGQVLDIDGDEFQVKYMKKKGQKYIWPEKEEVFWELRSKVVNQLSEPTMDQRAHYEFKATELDSVSKEVSKNFKFVYFQ